MEMDTEIADERRDSVEMPDLDLENLPFEEWVDAAEAWIKDNRMLAMLGAFAAGVFVGVMLRD